jgi:hypothetical protein
MNAVRFVIRNAAIQSGEKRWIAFVRQWYGREDFGSEKGLIFRAQLGDGFANFSYRTHLAILNMTALFRKQDRELENLHGHALHGSFSP